MPNKAAQKGGGGEGEELASADEQTVRAVRGDGRPLFFFILLSLNAILVLALCSFVSMLVRT